MQFRCSRGINVLFRLKPLKTVSWVRKRGAAFGHSQGRAFIQARKHYRVPGGRNVRGALRQFENKSYDVDEGGFLENPYSWDENFAEEMASRVKISSGLTASHWRVINFIRKTFLETGRCPAVYQTLRDLDLRMKDLKTLFPTGYLRGACKLSGLTYRAEHIHPLWLEKKGMDKVPDFLEKKAYRVDAYGFLIDPSFSGPDKGTFEGYCQAVMVSSRGPAIAPLRHRGSLFPRYFRKAV
jgi:tRNA 2-thiouridine synthesizing protein E